MDCAPLPASRRAPARGAPAAAIAAVLALIASLLAAASPSIAGGKSDFTVQIGLGHDDNPFETPSDPYFDQYDEVVVHPDKRSGFFIPFMLDGDFTLPGDKNQFVLDYRVSHEAYGKNNGNADETYLKMAPGYRLVTRRKGSRDDHFFAVPFVTYKKEIFFDRDTGVGQTIGFQNASDRYTYLATGGDVGYTSRVNRVLDWDVSAGFEQRDYEDVPSLSSLDHDRYELDTGLQITFTRRLKLYLDYTYRILDYDSRPSRDLDGGITADRTPVQYSYHYAGATLRYKPAEKWTFYFDVDYTGRIDDFVGYNDYDTLGGRVRAVWYSGPGRWRFAVRSRQREYPQAFIFDKEVNPGTGRANPNKDYDILDASVGYELPLRENFGFFAEADWLRQDTADPRFTYDELRISTGVSWDFESPSR